MVNVKFAGGGCDSFPGAYIPTNSEIPGNGMATISPSCGGVSESEGLDCMNYLFNHVNPASP